MFLTLCQQNVGFGMSAETRKVVTGMTHVKMTGLTEPDHWERTARLFPIDAGVCKGSTRSVLCTLRHDCADAPISKREAICWDTDDA